MIKVYQNAYLSLTKNNKITLNNKNDIDNDNIYTFKE